MPFHLPPLPDFKSPIRFVLRHVPHAATGIAPEREELLRGVAADVHLVITDDHKWACHYTPDKKEITLSRHVVELMWSAAYAYVLVYQTIFEGRSELEPRTFDLRATPELSAASRLLQWAYEKHFTGDDPTWPSDLPQPVENPAKGSMENVADELCLCGVAYLLHHELAHHRLGHRPSADTLEDERNADYEAADWLLRELDERDPRFQKRSLGVALALLIMTAHGIHSGWFDGESHPRAFDRLLFTLDRFIADKNHRTWGVVVSVLKLHLDAAQIATDAKAFDSFRECADHYADKLAALWAAAR